MTLTQRCQSAESIQAKLLPRIEAAEKLVVDIKAERVAEITSLTKWTERVSATLQQSAKLYASAFEELKNRSNLSAKSAEQISGRIAKLETLVNQFKAERLSESSSQAQWTERLSGELEQARKLYASATEEISRRSRLASSSSQETDQSIAALEGIANQLKADLATESTAHAGCTEKVTAELEQSATLYASAADEIQRRSRMAVADGDFGAHVEAAQSLFTDIKKSITRDASVQPESLQATADLKRAAEMSVAATAEIARRSRLAALRS